MIQICENFKIPLKKGDNYYQLFSNERLNFIPGELKLVKLPYFRTSFDKYLNVELDKSLVLRGLRLLWTNINDKDSAKSCIEIILQNSNIEMVFERNELTSIIGSVKKIDLLSYSVLFKVFTN